MNITRAVAIFLAVLPHPAVAQNTAQEAAPLLTPKPVFVPGLYQTESRNSAFQDQPAKGEVCIASADAEVFRRETMAQYQASPQFLKVCALSDTRTLPDGFAFAMACKESKVVLTFHFAKDLVSSTIQTLGPGAPGPVVGDPHLIAPSRRVPWSSQTRQGDVNGRGTTPLGAARSPPSGRQLGHALGRFRHTGPRKFG